MSHKCSVEGCNEDAYCEVILYDVYMHDGTVHFEQDYTCPYLCKKHLIENEESVSGERKPREISGGKYTNRECAQGFTIYRPLE